MARILVVGPRWDIIGLHGAALEPLKTLGIDTVSATLNGTLFSVMGRTFTANSTEARQFLNTFDAIFVLERRAINSNVNTLDQALNTWLTWNEPTDKPIVYFAPNLSTARTTLSLPSDFPIIRPDPINLIETTYLLGLNTWQVPSELQAQPHYSRLGGRFRLTREDVSVYTPAACAFLGSDAYFWRLDESEHLTLGTNGEILAYPDFPDREIDPDVIVAYRYKNRYFFPFIWEEGVVFRRDGNTTDGVSLFWLVYALKCLGIQPTRQAILCIEIDHPIEEKHNRPLDNQTRDEQYAIQYATYEWLASFGRQTGLVIPCGFTNGGRSRTSAYHYYYVQNYPAARAINDLLRRSADVLPNGVHDHTYTWGAVAGDFVRASTANVPVEYGVSGQNWVLVNPKVAPDSIRHDPSLPRTLDGFYNKGARMSGTGTTVSDLTNLCEYTAMMVLEDEFDEMRALGFADGHCGVHRYTNEAANSTGGEGYWKALIAMGFRGVRRTYHPRANFPSDPSRYQVLPSVARGYRYRGLQFVHSRVLDWFTGNNGSYGLYRAGTNDTAVGVYALDLGDLGDYGTNAATRWRVYRRIIGNMVGLWLVQALYFRGTVYVHPQGWFGASVSDPTGVVDTGDDLKVNPMVELLKAMREVQQVLSAYLRFGSPTDVMDLMEAVARVKRV